MKHNQNKNFKFVKEPIEFNKFIEKDLLQYCLGATLYMPGTKNVTDKILKKDFFELTSMVMCFEDAIKEEDLPDAQKNVLYHLETLSEAINNGTIFHDDIPLTFIRVRNVKQFESFVESLLLNHVKVLTGFVFPKFDSNNGDDYFRVLKNANKKYGLTLYGMPILEGKSLAFKESRTNELLALQNIFNNYENLVLNIRVGATDFSSLFGVRRGINYSIYDILTVRDCLSDILNFFNRSDNNYTISAPVWEYFLADKKADIGHFMDEDLHISLMKRNPILNEAIDGLLREVILDKANGFIGKTVIHPSHIKFVNAMQAVTREEYEDSCQILQTSGGVVKGKNKMNEINPHKSWARKIANRAHAFGVVENESSYFELFS